MATFTENYNLIQPGTEDYYDVADFNENMDTIDAQLAASEKAVGTVGSKVDTAQRSINGIASAIGTPPSGQTVVSLLQNGGSVIRSIQRVVYTCAEDNRLGGTVAIKTINPAKTFVFSERLANGSNNTTAYDYTVQSDSIIVTHGYSNPDWVKIGFWVVEFV